MSTSPKFTDFFIKLPVRVYKTELEEFEDTDTEDFAIAWARIHFEDLYTATWHEGYGKGTLGLSTKENGFDFTIVRTDKLTYYCTYSIKEFERELNKFISKIESLIPEPEDTQTEEDLEL